MAKVIQRSNLQVWGDVIFAIFLREIKSKFNDKFGIAWSVISPLAFIFMLAFIRGLMDGGETHGVPTFFFMVYGLLLVQLFLGVVGSVSSAIKKNKPLYAFRQVQPISSVIAISAFEILSKLFVLLIIGVISYYLNYEVMVYDPLKLILNFFQVGLLATCIGLLFALSSCFVPEIDKLRTLVMRPIFFISGIFFSLQDIPREFWPYLTWNPLLHAVELTRFAAYPHYGDAGVSSFYLSLCTLIALFFSLACYQISWKQAISR
ncbi:ABC transporter permease [Vibrio kyushuensis]|uniref:ABC transporter permease n=1 Tax=Vibrio kyushuensis TaxID=2910249 RepID=UPI003D0D2FB8